MGMRMGSDESPGIGGGDLSPEVERFLAPRATPPLRNAVLSATAAGVVASFAGFVVLACYEKSGLANSILAAKVVALKLSGSAAVANSVFAIMIILVAALACGMAGGALFGLLIAKLIGKVGISTAVFVGVSYGLVVWSVSQFVILASIAPNAVVLVNQHVVLTAHVVYGILLGLMSGWSREPRCRVTAFTLRHLWG